MHALSTKPEAADETDEEPLVVGFDDPAFDEVLAAINAETARAILLELCEEPLTASEVAGRVDTSVQNASYHLGKLSDAGLVDVPDCIYSEKGCEMKLYRAVETELHIEPNT